MNRSLSAQRLRILKALDHAGPTGLTTIQIRENLDCMMPSTRIYELRHNRGIDIQTIWTTDTNAQGNSHRTARYVLRPGKCEETL